MLGRDLPTPGLSVYVAGPKICVKIVTMNLLSSKVACGCSTGGGWYYYEIFMEPKEGVNLLLWQDRCFGHLNLHDLRAEAVEGNMIRLQHCLKGTQA